MMIHHGTQTWARRKRFLNVAGRALTALLLLLIVQKVGAEQGGPFASLMVDSDLATYNPQAQVSGSLKVQGSDTMSPLMTRLSAEFRRRQPQVTIEVKGGGSTNAVSELLQPPVPGRIVAQRTDLTDLGE